MVQQVGSDQKIKLLCVVGPTASGKTRLTVELAKKINGEIISCDSVQVYRGLDIGSAKPTAEEMGGIAHHMIDVVEPEESFSAADFAREAEIIARDIVSRGRMPIVAGGTGLYLQSLIYPPGFSPAGADEAYRAELKKRAEGGEDLHKLLASLDPESAARLHPNDSKRVIRALEVFKITGKPLSDYHGNPGKSPFSALIIGLNAAERAFLYDRINSRVDAMMTAGLLEETAALHSAGRFGTTTRKAIGYAQLIEYLEGGCSLDEAVELIKRETRRYAKRQMTWFRRDQSIKWSLIDRAPFEEIVEDSLKFVKIFTAPVP